MIVPFTSFSWLPYAGKFGEPMLHLYVDSPNTTDVANQLIRRPKGHRVVVFQNAAQNAFNNAADRVQGKFNSLWWTKGVAATKASFQTIIDVLAAKKADLDFAVFDVENGPSSYSMSAADMAALYADPRYAGLVSDYGFPADPRNLDEAGRMQFNYGCGGVFAAAMQECLIGPLYTHYPNLNWSNFNDCPISKADAPNVRDLNGHAAYYPPSAATYFSPGNYVGVYQLGNVSPIFKTAWGGLAWCVNTYRAGYRAKSGAKLMPWIGTRVDSNVLDLAHWTELVYHACCMAGPRLLFFNGDDGSALTNWRFDNAVSQYVSAGRGSVWSKTVTTDLADYADDPVVVSAARLVSGATVGRVTFKPGVKSAKVTVAGRTLTVTPETNGVGCWFKF